MPDKVRPIRPDEVAEKKKAILPASVIEAFNELIAQNFSRGRSEFTQEAVITKMEEKGLSRYQIIDNKWLDVEDIFEKEGWKVEYDKPGFNETYSARFIFIKKR